MLFFQRRYKVLVLKSTEKKTPGGMPPWYCSYLTCHHSLKNIYILY